jgi:hypothetical protein
MTEKSKTILLAIVTGSSGSSAQFAGKKALGWNILLICWVLLPGITWALLEYTSLNESMCLFFLSLSIVISHFILAVYHARSKAPEQTIELIKSRTGRVAISILLATLLAWASWNWVLSEKEIDTSKATPAMNMTSLDYSQGFLDDEDAFRKIHDKQVIRLSGKVIAIGEDFTEGMYIALEGVPGSAADVNCYFMPERQADITNIASGQTVTVTGVAYGRFLKNCYLNKDSN